MTHPLIMCQCLYSPLLTSSPVTLLEDDSRVGRDSSLESLPLLIPQQRSVASSGGTREGGLKEHVTCLYQDPITLNCTLLPAFTLRKFLPPVIFLSPASE